MILELLSLIVASEDITLSTPVLLNLSLCLFVCFIAIRPKSTAMVMAGRSVHPTTLFPEKA